MTGCCSCSPFPAGALAPAAFSYGVLETLRDTKVLIDGRERRLLDEVDWISGVSGGSFTAAYYGLFRDRIFEDFEARFLKKKRPGRPNQCHVLQSRQLGEAFLIVL